MCKKYDKKRESEKRGSVGKECERVLEMERWMNEKMAGDGD